MNDAERLVCIRKRLDDPHMPRGVIAADAYWLLTIVDRQQARIAELATIVNALEHERTELIAERRELLCALLA